MNIMLIIIVGIIFIAIGPFIGIWSLNTLFPILVIPYTIETWTAFTLLFGFVGGLQFRVR